MTQFPLVKYSLRPWTSVTVLVIIPSQEWVTVTFHEIQWNISTKCLLWSIVRAGPIAGKLCVSESMIGLVSQATKTASGGHALKRVSQHIASLMGAGRNEGSYTFERQKTENVC